MNERDFIVVLDCGHVKEVPEVERPVIGQVFPCYWMTCNGNLDILRAPRTRHVQSVRRKDAI